MPLLPKKLRTIRESERAAETLAEAYKQYPRFEDVWTCGDTWRLAREPENGVLLGTGHRIMKFPSYVRLAPIPGRTILYSYTDQYIDIVSVKFGEED